MIDRRTFIESSIAAGTLAATGVSRATAGSESVPDQDRPPPWSQSEFEQRIGQRFRLSGPLEAPASLVAVESCSCDRRVEAFHLCFAVDGDVAPREGLYRLSRPVAGGLHLHLQPRGSDPAGRWILEATVSRLIA